MPHRYQGFTLLELLVVLAIVGILLVQATPLLGNLVQTSHRHAEISVLITLLNLARNTAVSEGQSVTVCALDANLKCVNNWSRPIVAFRDPDRSRQVSSNTQIIRQFEPSNRGRFFLNASNRNYLRFFSTGMAWGTMANVVWCPASGDARLAAQLRINIGGRVQQARDKDGDGVVENAQGQPVSCP